MSTEEGMDTIVTNEIIGIHPLGVGTSFVTAILPNTMRDEKIRLKDDAHAMSC